MYFTIRKYGKIKSPVKSWGLANIWAPVPEPKHRTAPGSIVILCTSMITKFLQARVVISWLRCTVGRMLDFDWRMSALVLQLDSGHWTAELSAVRYRSANY